jgi:hypothetical protein
MSHFSQYLDKPTVNNYQAPPISVDLNLRKEADQALDRSDELSQQLNNLNFLIQKNRNEPSETPTNP